MCGWSQCPQSVSNLDVAGTVSVGEASPKETVALSQPLPYSVTVAPELIEEFPFVESLPKSEKSKLAKIWDAFHAARALSAEHGILLHQSFVALLLDISRQRVKELIKDGRLKAVMLGDKELVTENSVIAWAQAEHKAGRPVNVPSTIAESYRRTKKALKVK